MLELVDRIAALTPAKQSRSSSRIGVGSHGFDRFEEGVVDMKPAPPGVAVAHTFDVMDQRGRASILRPQLDPAKRLRAGSSWAMRNAISGAAWLRARVMPALVRSPQREVRSRTFDSARWNAYQPRADDIIIATYPKCGTTWMQRIVGMLVFQSAEPMAVQEISPWLDMRILGPVERIAALAEAQTHRRFLKAHLPYDALPVYEGVKFIHVARDGRDAAMSYHNHQSAYSADMIKRITDISLADPKFGTPYKPPPADAAEYFHQWVSDQEVLMGDPYATFFHVENSFWAVKDEFHVLLVHFNDLEADRDGEMRRVAEFLGIETPAPLWPALVEAAGFAAMKKVGKQLLPGAEQGFEGGAERFLFKGKNGRWRDAAHAEDLAMYEARVKAEFPPDLAHWIEHGRLG